MQYLTFKLKELIFSYSTATIISQIIIQHIYIVQCLLHWVIKIQVGGKIARLFGAE